MFDWDDQELANIIWGEGREADDHIVPYQEDLDDKDQPDYGDNDKKTLKEEDTNNKAAEKRPSTSKLFPDGAKQRKNDGLSASKVVIDPQIDLPSFAASETDNSAIAKKTELDIGSEVPRNPNEDKELGELVGNSWANIGSFDDLDRIFSNDDLDVHTSLGSTDELWSSSKDLISGEANSSSAALGLRSWEFGALRNTSSHLELNAGYLHNESPTSTTGFQKTDSIRSCYRRTIDRHVEQEDYAVGNTNLVEEKTALGTNGKTSIDSHVAPDNIAPASESPNKDDWSKNHPKHEQIPVKTNGPRRMQDVYDKWPSSAANIPQYDHQCAQATLQDCPASVPTQQRLPHESTPMAYQHFTNPYVAAYGNFPQQYRAMHMVKPTEDEQQSILSSSEACPGEIFSLNTPLENAANPMKMTPQEKIEKLRRRQKLRAMLAIQKQQQRLVHQASSVDYPISQKSCQEDPVLQMDKNELEGDEGFRMLPCYNPGSPNKRDDFCTACDMDECSVEETVTYQLQNIIAGLDMKIRLCIRDSLYRLAHSATQRHHANTNRSGNYDPDVAKEEIRNNDRIAGNANVETETNRIDRAVAHLLFHRPLKLSVRHPETPESPTSDKVPIGKEIAIPSSLRVSFLAEISANEVNRTPHGSSTPQPHVESCEEVMPNDVSQAEIRANQQT